MLDYTRMFWSTSVHGPFYTMSSTAPSAPMLGLGMASLVDVTALFLKSKGQSSKQ